MDIPYVDQLAGLWCLESQAANLLASQAASLATQASLQRLATRPNPKPHRVTEGDVSILRLAGPLTKHQSSFSTSGSTVLFRQALSQASREPNTKSILIHIESPGGTAAGTHEAAEAIKDARTRKPVHAYIEDLGASAAYWISSQADSISANLPARIGSIGTYASVSDLSQAAIAQGIKVHLISTGKYKGMGAPGTEITSEHLAEIRSQVESTNEHFLSAVSVGRKLPLARVKALADGRVYPAEQAKQLGLIDRVESFDKFLARHQTAGTKTNSPNSADTLTNLRNGVKPDPVKAFTDAVNTLQGHGMSKLAATKAVCESNPQLHRDYVAQINS